MQTWRDVDRQLYRARRIKCDEQKPVCKRCCASNLPCGENLLYSNAARRPGAAAARRGGTLIPPAPSSVPELHGSADVRDLLDLVPLVASRISDTFVANPANAGAEYLLFGGRQLTLYFDYLPSRLRRSDALDGAIACVVAALRDAYLPEDCRAPARTFACYARALQVLQKSLSDKSECCSGEVMCAIQLLGIFEVCCRWKRRKLHELTAVG